MRSELARVIAVLVGTRMRRLRQEAGLRQADLAAMAGTHRPIITRTEAGRHLPSIAQLRRLAGALGSRGGRLVEVLADPDAWSEAEDELERRQRAAGEREAREAPE